MSGPKQPAAQPNSHPNGDRPCVIADNAGTARLVCATLHITSAAAAIGLWAAGLIPSRLSIPYATTAIAAGILLSLRPCRLLTIKLLLLFTTTAGTLICAELAMRAAIPRRIYYRPDEMFIHRHFQMPLVSRYKGSATFQGATFGDLSAMSGDKSSREMRNVRFTTDEHGFRNNTESTQQPVNALILGDSFGVGTGTTQEETWASLLRTKYGINAYNLSLPGSPWHSFINLKMESTRLRTTRDCTVLAAVFSGNDLDDDYGPSLDIQNLPWNRRLNALQARLATFRNRCVIRQLFSRWKSTNRQAATNVEVRKLPSGKEILFYKPHIKRSLRTEPEILEHEHFSRLRDVILGLHKYCEERSWRLVVLVFPSKEEVYTWLLAGTQLSSEQPKNSAFAHALARFCGKSGITTLDLGPEMAQAAKRLYSKSGALLWWADDTHWNEHGHAVATDIIYTHIFRKPRHP